MLTEAFPQLQRLRAVTSLRAFFRSGWFAGVVVILMACSELFGAEIAVIYCYLAFGLLIALLCDDMLPIVPMVACGYMLFSAQNNPGKFPDSLFGRAEGQLALFYAIALVVVILIGRLVSMLLQGGRRGVPKLLWGFLALGAAYLLSGLFSPYYDGRTALMGFVQIAALCGFYFYFYFTVRWENVPRGYLPLVVTAVGAGLLAEIAGMYFNPGVIGPDGSIDRAHLYTGWGIYNNVGCMMAMCMPAPVWFALKKKHGWAFTILNTVYYLGALLTQSRGTMLFATLVYLACVVVTLVGAKKGARRQHVIVYAAVLAAAAVGIFLFREQVADLFASVISQGFNDSARFDTWRACWQRFLEYPVFGVGFYKTPGTVLTENGMLTEFVDGTPEGMFLALRSHNTCFQLIATGGAVALAAYLFHRIQTLVLCLRRPNAEKIVALLCIFSLLLTSLTDCHMFNMGPGLLYSILLVFSEKSPQAQAAQAEGSKSK